MLFRESFCFKKTMHSAFPYYTDLFLFSYLHSALRQSKWVSEGPTSNWIHIALKTIDAESFKKCVLFFILRVVSLRKRHRLRDIKIRFLLTEVF